MPEESSEGKEQSQESRAFDEAKLAELIKSNVSSSMESLKDDLKVISSRQQEPVREEKEEGDFWSDIIDPRVDKKVAQASLMAEAVQDKVDFYSSDEWLVTADEWLTEDDPQKRKEEKAALRADVEKCFNNLIKSGRGLPRADIFNALLGEKIKKDGVKFRENIGKKARAQQETELAQARRGVDMTSVMADFSPESVHKMDWNKVTETYGSVTF